ncbi:MAG: DUF4421 domain-containing protein [Spirochaetes bacterium]|nr:DUF4421 domain-containing protein [Spirochaetota bacterium]
MQNLKFLITLFFIWSALMPAFSADETERKGYVRIEYNFGMPDLSFGDNNSYDLSLGAENNSSLGITAGYKDFVLGVDTDTVFGGETVLRDIFISWFGESLGIELFYQSFKDYYIEDGNLNKKYPGPNEYPDMRIMNTGISCYYFFRQNTYRNISRQDEGLLENGWSPYLKLSAGRFSVDNDESIIPAADRPQFEPDAGNFNRYHSWQAFLSAGISGTLALSRFYITAIVSLGAGGEYNRHSVPGGSYKKDINFIPDFDYQMAAGYIGKDFFTGFSALNENQFGRIDDLYIQLMNLQASCFAGVFF